MQKTEGMFNIYADKQPYLTYALYYKGKDVEELSKEELIHIIKETVLELRKTHDRFMEFINVASTF